MVSRVMAASPTGSFPKGCKVRDENPTFMAMTERFYRQIFTQVQGLQWKDGGPVIAAQFDNEYRGSGDYLMAGEAVRSVTLTHEGL